MNREPKFSDPCVASVTDFSDSDLPMASNDPPNLQCKDFNFTATWNVESDRSAQFKKPSVNHLPAQRLFKKSLHVESILRRSKPPRRNLIQQNTKPRTSITTHTKFTAKLANPVIGFILVPYTYGVKPLVRLRHRKRKQGNNNNLNAQNHHILNLQDDAAKSDNAVQNTSDASASIGSKKTPNITKNIKNIITGRHTQENNKEKEKILFRPPALTMSLSEKLRNNQTGGVDLGEMIHIRQKLRLFLHGPGLSYRILRWICIIALSTNPLVFISGILPIMLLWMVFGDLIRFILHQGHKLAEGRLPNIIVQIVRKSVRETQESERARKKYVYAAGVANKFVFKQK